MSDSEGLKRLREPFPERHISQLPKGGTTLSYVGHAALTSRLLDVDPLWNWEPLAFTEHGLPRFDETGGLWIRLTVCGMTRLGYGHAAAKKGEPGAREKEVIGDALRNAAMRFGAALDLWHKGGDLNGPSADAEPDTDPDPGALAARAKELLALIQHAATPDELARIVSDVEAEWSDLKKVEGFKEAVRAQRISARERLGIAP